MVVSISERRYLRLTEVKRLAQHDTASKGWWQGSVAWINHSLVLFSKDCGGIRHAMRAF